MLDIIFVTGSQHKLIEAERILRLPLQQRLIDLEEIQAVEVEKVVEHKARSAYQLLKQPVIIEDTGLYIQHWNGLPGALIKWFMERVGAEGICEMLRANTQRAAYAKTIVALFDGSLHLFEGVVEGSIAVSPVGSQGFGWDSIFIPNGSAQTFAQMRPEEKDAFSMRRIAFQRMQQFLVADGAS